MRANVYVMVVLWVAPLLFLIGGVLFLPDSNASGQCEGLGFGCTLTPADTARFGLMFLTPVLLILGLVALLLLHLLRKAQPRFAAAWPMAQAAAVLGVVAAGTAAVVAVL